MQHLDEGTIHAWLDGELPAAEREAAEAHVAQCAACAAAVAEARGFIAASSRILTALDAVPGGVLPGAPRAPATRRFTIPRAWMAVAAVLVLGIGTVIATRSPRDVGALRVAAERESRAAPAVAPHAAAPAPDSLAMRAEGLAAPAQMSKSPASNIPSPKPAGVASGSVARAEKSQARTDRERKDAGVRPNDSTPLMIADAARAAPAAKAEDSRDAMRVSGALQPQAPAPAALADSTRQRRFSLNEVVVTGAGAAAPREADSAKPRLVSRDTATQGADTIVTTIYDVRGTRVSLIDRPSRMEPKPPANGFSDAVMAKARAVAVNSITWSDSAGRTHTLRGALSSADLERIKAQLFGATP